MNSVPSRGAFPFQNVRLHDSRNLLSKLILTFFCHLWLVARVKSPLLRSSGEHMGAGGAALSGAAQGVPHPPQTLTGGTRLTGGTEPPVRAGTRGGNQSQPLASGAVRAGSCARGGGGGFGKPQSERQSLNRSRKLEPASSQSLPSQPPTFLMKKTLEQSGY